MGLDCSERADPFRMKLFHAPGALGGRALRGLYANILLLVFLHPSMFGAPPPSPQDEIAAPGGVVAELPATEADVLQAVTSVAADSLVRGTRVYEKEETLAGAVPAETSPYFGRWQGPGHVFYKIRTGALAPRHFKNSSDIGTITVRYVVQAVNDTRARLRIDAVFVEDARRRAHPSDGTVESSEFKAIQEQLRQIQSTKQETAAALKERQEEETRKVNLLREREEEVGRLSAAESSVRNLEQRLHDLQHDLEVRIKEQGTELKSAPFHSAAKLQSLSAGADVVVLIVTPYWYGVETTDRHRGWLRRDQVESLP